MPSVDQRVISRSWSTSLCALLALAPLLIKGQGYLLLNEVMASNSITVVDATGEYEDWIEIFNSGSTAVSLAGWSISDDPALPGKHVLTGPENELTVPPQGHLLLWASGDTARGPTHLGFSISASGEPLLFTDPQGQLADMIILTPQITDVSFGRAGDGGAAWLYFDQSTPQSQNASEGFIGQAEPPVFSIPAGIYTNTLSLSISQSQPDATIYYTLDGSIPGPDLVGGYTYTYKNTYPNTGDLTIGAFQNDTLRAFEYNGPLQVTDPVDVPNFLSRRTTTAHTYHPSEYMPYTPVRKARIVRARAYRPGHLPSPVVTNTYLFTSDGASPYELPMVSLTTNRENLIGFDNGIYNAGTDYEQWRLANPDAPQLGTTPANWRRSSEHPMSMEWFDEGATQRSYEREFGFRIHGSYSRLFRRKSMRFYFRQQYGHETLGQQMFSTQEDTDFKRLVLHISGNDDGSSNMRDMTFHAMVRHMRNETMDSRPVAVMLNGEFWGVHSFRERYDAKYLERVLGLAEDEIDLVENGGVIEMGDDASWLELMQLVAEQDPADPQVYEEIRARVDVDDHIDQIISHVYLGNWDWPSNNWKAYRKRTAGLVQSAAHGHDGRWRWLLFDTDFGFNLNGIHPADFGFLAWALEPSHGMNNLLVRRSLLNQEYRHAFINRAADMLNTAFQPDVVNSIIEYHAQLIEHDMHEHVQRWPDTPQNIAEWHSKIDAMYSFGEQRQGFFRQELQSVFALPAQHALTVDVSDVNAGWVELNSIELLPTTHGVSDDPYPWQGVYFESVPVKLVAHALPGWEFSHWEGVAQGVDSIAVVSLTSTSSVTAVFEPVPWCAHETIHYWHFNDLPDGPLGPIAADISLLQNASISYPGEGVGYMDRTNIDGGTALNVMSGTVAGRALRARNPSDTRHLLIESPSVGHRDITLSFATHRTTAGADQQQVSYTVDPERIEWVALSDVHEISEEFEVKEYSLEGILETFDQPHLAFKIEFLGDASGGSEGNDRFDNVTVQGRPITTIYEEVCENGSYSYEGIEYWPGVHLHPVQGVMDCGQVVLLKLEEIILDTLITVDGNLLSATPQVADHQWIDCATMLPIENADQPTYYPVEEGSYAVQLNRSGCIAISGCHYAPGDPNVGILVHPNPANDMLFIYTGYLRNESTYRMIDASGRIVRVGAITRNSQRIFISDLAPGGYIVQIIDDRTNSLLGTIKVVLD